MIRCLQAFALLRWRLFVNGLRGRRRDSLEQVSRISRLFVIALVVVTIVPGSALMTVLAFLGGRGLAQGNEKAAALLVGARLILLAVTVMVAISPLLRFGGASTSMIRLALLPIPRRLLFAFELVAQLADPWILAILPSLAALPAGLAAGGAWGAAAWVAFAGVAIALLLAALGSAASLWGALLFRNRRLGEIAAIGLLVVLSAAGYLPMVLHGGRRSPAPVSVSPLAVLDAQPGARVLPSELYGRAVSDAVAPARGSPALPLAALAVIAIVLGGAARFAFGRLLDAPGERRNRSSRTPARLLALPGFSPTRAAIAWTTFRLLVRSVRGRVILFTSPIPVLMMGFLWRRGALGSFAPTWTGIAIAAVGGGIALLALSAVLADQFAVDRAGLTLVFLGPASDRDIVLGKAAGGALAIAIPAGAAFVIGLVFHPGGAPLLWAATAVAIAAAYLAQSPIAAFAAATFPAPLDLTKLRSGNAHPLAALITMLSLAIAYAACCGIPLLAFVLSQSPAATFAASLAVLAVAAGFATLAFPLAAKTLGGRRENLAMIAQGR
jgi:hypothetical protein